MRNMDGPFPPTLNSSSIFLIYIAIQILIISCPDYWSPLLSVLFTSTSNCLATHPLRLNPENLNNRYILFVVYNIYIFKKLIVVADTADNLSTTCFSLFHLINRTLLLFRMASCPPNELFPRLFCSCGGM